MAFLVFVGPPKYRSKKKSCFHIGCLCSLGRDCVCVCVMGMDQCMSMPIIKKMCKGTSQQIQSFDWQPYHMCRNDHHKCTNTQSNPYISGRFSRIFLHPDLPRPLRRVVHVHCASLCSPNGLVLDQHPSSLVRLLKLLQWLVA